MPTCEETEAALLRSWDAERTQRYGTGTTYWSLTRGANVDPLYSEPNDWAFDTTDGTAIKGWLQYVQADQRNVAVIDQGLVVDHDATLMYDRNTWESLFPTRSPKEGDVVKAHSLSWDVVKADKNGMVLDTEEHVGWKLMLKKREKFLPKRKLP